MKKISLCLMLMFSLISPVQADEAGDFSQVYEKHGYQMELRGVGEKHFFFREVFEAGLYLPEDVNHSEVLGAVPKRIEVNYNVHITSERLSDYTEELIKKNVSSEDFLQMNKDLQRMRTYFVDLKPGDQFALTYVPELGTMFEYNGNSVGVIEGEKFAMGLFSTWLGANPMDHRIKNKILGITERSS